MELQAARPDIIVSIYSDGSRFVLNKIKSEIPVDKQERLDPTVPNKFLERAKSLAIKYKDD